MRLLLDTNVVLDVLAHREPFFEDSWAIMDLKLDSRLELLVSASQITDVYYSLRKEFERSEDRLDKIRALRRTVKIVDATDEHIGIALDSHLGDFEDAVVDAVAWRHGADYIITRNAWDFQGSRVPALTTSGFLEGIQ